MAVLFAQGFSSRPSHINTIVCVCVFMFALSNVALKHQSFHAGMRAAVFRSHHHRFNRTHCLRGEP